MHMFEEKLIAGTSLGEKENKNKAWSWNREGKFKDIWGLWFLCKLFVTSTNWHSVKCLFFLNRSQCHFVMILINSERAEITVVWTGLLLLFIKFIYHPSHCYNKLCQVDEGCMGGICTFWKWFSISFFLEQR